MSAGIWVGTLASSLSQGDFTSIQTITVGAGGASSIDFTSIPQNYKTLQLRITTPFTVQDGPINIRWNGLDTAYNGHWFYGRSDTLAAYTYDNDSGATVAYDHNRITRNSAYNKVTIVEFVDYAMTSKSKTARSISGYDAGTAGVVTLEHNRRIDTAAITSIKIQQYGYDGTYGWKNLAQNTVAALYGMAG